MTLPAIQTQFENASPVDWAVEPDGTVLIGLFYDHEIGSPNRAAGHWHFQLQAPPGARVRLVIERFDNIWNGRPGSPISDRTSCFISPDGRAWSAIPAPKIEGNRLEVTVPMEAGTLFLARLEPYRLSDLERLLAEVRAHPAIAVEPIGRTVEGRELEMVRVGRPDAPGRVLLRARSHPWEPGGNWVVQGLIRGLLAEDAVSRGYLDRYAVYIMPMAAKDGVVGGHTRFNVRGVDLNRGWDRPADPILAPENHALETWLDASAARGRLPHLAIDLHNDNSGRLHLSRPEGDTGPYLARMEILERLLYDCTWFTEGTTGAGFRNDGTFGEGLLARYGIDACILELNCDWIAGLRKVPFGRDWELFGRQLRDVLFAYFGD